VLSHPKWGSVSGEWTVIDNYTFFNNTTRILDLNKKFKLEVLQLDKKIDYFKARFNQWLNFGKFSWINNVQYQKTTQEENPDELLSGPQALNVPEWLVRSTLMLTSSMFNRALFFQSGATFVFFTDYYADQYNPLIAEFVTQNNTKIGEYPRVDFFFNAKIKSSRLFVKLENINAPIEHLIFPDTPYDYYAAPFIPYRDFSLRIGLIWNFFE
jgi:outer membrane receptor protein involved in Fe transport